MPQTTPPTAPLTMPLRNVLPPELHKLARAPVARVTTLSTWVLSSAVTTGGYAAAVHAPDTDLGRKVDTMLTAPGWTGFTGVAVQATGVAVLLAAGILMSWATGREFTDGTIVGLLAIPPRPQSIAGAKALACAVWVVALSACTAVTLALGGTALGLPPGGAPRCALTLLVAGTSLGLSMTPVMWASTRWRGYLPGIGVTLAIVVATNVAAGLGAGAWVPWAAPILWASGALTTPAPLLAPAAAGVAGVAATLAAWGRLQLGRG